MLALEVALGAPSGDRRDELGAMLESKDAAEHLRTEGMSPVGGTPEQLLALIKKEIQIYRKVATDLGLKAE